MPSLPGFKVFCWLITAIFLSNHNIYPQAGLEIKFQPDQSLYVYESKGLGTPVQLYTAVIQNMAIINRSNRNITIDNVEIVVTREGSELQRQVVPDTTFMRYSKMYKAYQEQGILKFYDFQFQTSRYLQDILISGDRTLVKDQAILIPYRAMLFQILPDRVTVQVKAHDSAGKSLMETGSLAVIDYQSENDYYFPLKGTWIALGAPSLISHHRWGSIQEFAFDFVKLGVNGSTHSGDGSKLSDYYAYGEPVYAVADGTVVSTYAEADESDKHLKQPNETGEEFLERSSASQQKLLSHGFSFVLGNHVIIEHHNGEYSYYMHLKKGSIKVKTGADVKRGQLIAALGNSGNSTEPHLHFHITDGPDIAYSRSLPVTFKNISLYPDEIAVRHLHYGQIIITKN